MNLENASTNIAAVKGMETALNMQKKIAHQIDSDKVSDLMDKLEEQNDVQNEVNDLFASSREIFFFDLGKGSRGKGVFFWIDGFVDDFDIHNFRKCLSIPWINHHMHFIYSLSFHSLFPPYSPQTPP